MDIVNEIGMEAMLGQLAEECAELAQAALKMQRILHGTNPTPVTMEQARANLLEEATDVGDCLGLLAQAGVAVFDSPQSEEKLNRWETRIKAHKSGLRV